MASIETFYELKGCAQYLVADEDYCPDEGWISKNFLKPFGEIEDPETLLRTLASQSSEQNYLLPEPCDLTIIRTSPIEAIGRLVKTFKLNPEDFDASSLVDPKDPEYEHDLFALVMGLNRVSGEDQEVFKNLFHQAIVYYQVNLSKSEAKIHSFGIAILKNKTYAEFTEQHLIEMEKLQYTRLMDS